MISEELKHLAERVEILEAKDDRLKDLKRAYRILEQENRYLRGILEDFGIEPDGIGKLSVARVREIEAALAVRM